MFTAKSVWGIDIGDSCIKAVKLSPGEESITVEDFDYIELDIELKKKSSYLDVLREGIETMVARKDFSKSEVCVSISAKSVNSRFISIDNDLKPKEYAEEVKAEAEKQIPFPLDEVEWGYHSFPSDDDEGTIALFAVRSEHIKSILDIMDDCGLKVRGVQVPGVALYNFMRAISDVEDHVVVLDFGEKTTDLLLIYNDSFWLRSLPLSGSQITDLLEKKFRITTKEANTLKHEMEKSPQKDKLFRVIEPKLKELVVEIKRSVNFRKTQVSDLDPKSFFAFGGSSQLPGAAAFFSKNLKLEDYKMDFDALDFDECEDADQILENIPSYGVAFGLALQGIGTTEVELNLIPKKYLFSKILKSKRIAAVVANVAFLAIILMSFLGNSSITEKLEVGKRKVEGERSRLQRNIGKYSGKREKLKPLIQDLDYHIHSLQGDDYVAKIYNEVVEQLNEVEKVYLVDIKIESLSAKKFMDKVVNVSDEAYEPIVVKIRYIGDDASSNRKFYDALMKRPVFMTVEGGVEPVLNGGRKEYEWGYKPKLTVEYEDPFSNNTEVAKLREEKGWVVQEVGEEKKKKYRMDFQELEFVVNEKSLKGMDSEAKK